MVLAKIKEKNHMKVQPYLFLCRYITHFFVIQHNNFIIIGAYGIHMHIYYPTRLGNRSAMNVVILSGIIFRHGAFIISGFYLKIGRYGHKGVRIN